MRTCKIEGCNNKHDSKGWCGKHYARWRRHGDPLQVDHGRINRPDICKIEGCDGKHKGYGYCVKHYQRYKKYGDPYETQVIRDHPDTCTLDDCNEPYYVKGYCTTHYRRFNKYGDPYMVKKRGQQPLPEGHAARNKLIYRYRQHAEKRGYKWDLEDEQVIDMFEGDCFYCGSPPYQETSKTEQYNGTYTYNGMDRVDNDKGYTIDNVVSCCGKCNRAKDTMSAEEFITQAKRIAARH